MIDNNYKLWEEQDELKNIEKKANQNHIPIIDKKTANILKTIVLIKKPKLILEIGTAIGYSTLWLAEYSPQYSEIVTIERNEELLNLASKNIKDFGYKDKVKFKCGQAEEIIPYFRRKFDLVFIDAAKGQYLNLFKKVQEKISDNGIIICDNVFYKGLVRKNKKLTHKIRTIVVNMRDFLHYLEENDDFKTDIIDLADGISISRRRNKDEESRTAGPGR